MSENTNTPTDELDLDEWLAGGQRNTRLVVLYARNDLHADIQELEKQLVDVPEVAEGDEALAGEANPNAEIEVQINLLWQQLGASKREFRVAGRTTEETQAIEDQVRKDLEDEINRAAAYGRTEGKKAADRMGVKAVEDVNRMVRASAMEHASRVVNFEVSVRTIAESTTMRRGETWVPVSPAQVRKMYEALGEAQVSLLAAAAQRSASEVPQVTIPKS